MTVLPDSEGLPASKPGGTRRRFTAGSIARLTTEETRRESRAIRLALDVMGLAAGEKFLNDHHAGLGGRPIALAAASHEGMAAVELWIFDKGHLPKLPQSTIEAPSENPDRTWI